MYTDDGCWIQTNEDASVHLRPSPHHHFHNLWITDSTSKQYSPTSFNISSTYSSSSSPVPDPSFLTDNITNTSVILDSQYNPYFNNTGNLHVPYRYMWDKEDDYYLYTSKSCYCELQKNEQISHSEIDSLNYYQTREVNGFLPHKICGCTPNYPSICEIHSLDINGDKSRKITTDYSIQSTKIYDYPECMVPEKSNHNSNTFIEDTKNSSWFTFSPLLSMNSKLDNTSNESSTKWPFNNFTTISNDELLLPSSSSSSLSSSSSKTCTENYLTNHNEMKLNEKNLLKPYRTNVLNDNLIRRSLMEKSSIPMTNFDNNDNNNNGGNLMAAASAALANLHRRGSLQLWQFLIALLDDKESQHLICWTGRKLEFKLNDPEEVARLWGIQKNRPAMNYDKLSRSLRYYYEKGIMQKVSGERYVYRFVYEPELLFSLAFPGEEHSNQQPISSTTTAKTNTDDKSFGQLRQLTDNSLSTPYKLGTSNSQFCFPSNHFNNQQTDNNTECIPTNEEKFGVKLKHNDILEGENKNNNYKQIHETPSSTVVTNGNDNQQVQLPNKYGCVSVFLNDEGMCSKQNINNSNIITPNQHYNENGKDFLMYVYGSQNNFTDKLSDNSNWSKTDSLLPANSVSAINESLTSHIDWFDNLTIQREQEQQLPMLHCTSSENHHTLNYSSNLSNYHQYDLEHSLLSSPNVCNEIDIWSDRQDYYLSEVINETYNKEQEKLLSPSSSSSSSSPPVLSSQLPLSSSSFVSSLNDRNNMLSTPPPITINLQNIYEINYELLKTNDELTYHPF
ncbi:unnamed protein product [Schistosoma rodhaini]|uniref:ETS domain-containing protein n=1 Tax=Schistosoma rodhaini TaxID=6188 RepID=A0AA85G7M7_9TREM|nr:unnamed protein product [Schistosoma rodhaini]CAH8601469.1 unnamed protein product [Schistosoma rodhaini]